MTHLAEGESNQILLLAPNLLGESLAMQLTRAEPELEVFLKEDQLTRHPCLVIWSIESIEVPSAIELELKKLQEYWTPTPLLLILPARLRLNTTDYLQFDCPGLLQDPNFQTLRESIKTLRNGGRVVKLKHSLSNSEQSNESTLGISQWFLLSGIQQINNELQKIDLLLNPPPDNTIKEFILYGRRNELKAAKKLLYLIWGPLKVSTELIDYNLTNNNQSKPKISSIGFPLKDEFETNIILNQRNSKAVWSAIPERLIKTIQEGLINSTGSLMAIEVLTLAKRRALMNSILTQYKMVLNNILDTKKIQPSYKKVWSEF